MQPTKPTKTRMPNMTAICFSSAACASSRGVRSYSTKITSDVPSAMLASNMPHESPSSPRLIILCPPPCLRRSPCGTENCLYTWNTGIPSGNSVAFHLTCRVGSSSARTSGDKKLVPMSFVSAAISTVPLRLVITSETMSGCSPTLLSRSLSTSSDQ